MCHLVYVLHATPLMRLCHPLHGIVWFSMVTFRPGLHSNTPRIVKAQIMFINTITAILQRQSRSSSSQNLLLQMDLHLNRHVNSYNLADDSLLQDTTLYSGLAKYPTVGQPVKLQTSLVHLAANSVEGHQLGVYVYEITQNFCLLPMLQMRSHNACVLPLPIKGVGMFSLCVPLLIQWSGDARLQTSVIGEIYSQSISEHYSRVTHHYRMISTIGRGSCPSIIK